MAGILAFVLGMDSTKYRAAVQGAVDQTNKFIKVSELAGKASTEWFNSMSEMKKNMVLDASGVEKHTGNLRHMRHELNLVGEAANLMGGQMGALGSLAGLAFDPWLVAIGAVVIALNALQELWRTRIEQMASVISRMQNLATARMEAGVNATAEAARANVDFYESLLHSSDGLDRETQAMERRLALIAATVTAQREVFAAQTRATEATIASAEAMHQIGPMQAEARRQMVETAAWENQHETELRQLQEGINQRQNRLSQAPGALANAERDHDAATSNAGEHNHLLLSERARIADLRQNLDAQVAGYAQSAAFARAVSGVANSVGGNWGGIVRWAGSQRFDVAHIDQGQLAQARDLLQAGEQRVAGLERQQSILERIVSQTDARAQIEMGILNTYPQQISQEQQLLGIRTREYRDEAHSRAEGIVAAMTRQEAGARAQAVGRMRGVTSLERMGMHFRNGGPTLLTDHAMQSLVQAQRQTRLLEQIYQAILHSEAGLPTLSNILTNQMP